MPVKPLVTAPYIEFGSWSPDAQWIAYWISSQEDVEQPTNFMPGGTLNFRNVTTAETCAVPQFVRPDNRSAEVYWSDEMEAIVSINQEAFSGKPCQAEPFRKLDNYVKEQPLTDPTLSPDGKYRAATSLESNENGILTLTTTITAVDRAQPLQRATWRIDERLGEYGLEGEWISKAQFVLYETFDQGPLILDIEHGIIPILTELLGLEKVPSLPGVEQYGSLAIPFPGMERDSFHLLVQGVGTESNFPQIKLYHAENELVETLPFKHVWREAFSYDGQWLLMDKRPDVGGYESQEIWIRRVEEMDDDWQMIASSVDSIVWANDWSEMAFNNGEQITWQTFPEAELLGKWGTGQFSAHPVAWSPDGRSLVTIGNIPGIGEYGLFILER